jgi:hypothetical protein
MAQSKVSEISEAFDSSSILPHLNSTFTALTLYGGKVNETILPSVDMEVFPLFFSSVASVRIAEAAGMLRKSSVFVSLPEAS